MLGTDRGNILQEGERRSMKIKVSPTRRESVAAYNRRGTISSYKHSHSLLFDYFYRYFNSINDHLVGIVKIIIHMHLLVILRANKMKKKRKKLRKAI